MKRELNDISPYTKPNSFAAGSSSGAGEGGYSSAAAGKSKMWEDEKETRKDNGMDELFAVLGYQVRSSEMAQVAQKLEQLEEVMGSVQEDGLSHLASETTHYNPSDLSTWLESILSELNTPPNLDPVNPFASLHFDNEPSSSAYDLKAIPGTAILGQNPSNVESSSSCESQKKLKSSPGSNSNSNPDFISAESTRPVVLVDSQENGVQLVQNLMACAEAIQQNNLAVADAIVKRVGCLAVSQAGAMRKVATYFAEALARRIYSVHPQSPFDHSMSEILQMNFYETCPYLKFAHFTANQAILEAFEGKKMVHVIDFGINQGLQWPALIQALALRPGGPPAFRLTGIGPPSPDKQDRLQEVGWKLAQLAKTINIIFEYRGFVVNSLADLDASMLELRPSEVESVAVNSVFELHKLLAFPGAIEKVLNTVKVIKPEIFTIVEQEANHNGPVFLDRFTESLHYYSTMFDSLEGSVSSEDKLMSEMYLGKQICNVVACEGVHRVERHETLTQWRTRLGSAGFVPVHLGSNAFKQASMLLELFTGGDGYKVEENNGCLTLGWHMRPLIATSAWGLGKMEAYVH